MTAGRPWGKRDKLERILELRGKGYKIRQIAVELSISKSVVQRMLKRFATNGL